MKVYAKNILRGLFLLLALPFFLLYKASCLLIGQSKAFTSHSQLLSLFPGEVGNYLRLAFYQLSMSHCGTDIVISFGILFSQQETEIQSGTYIGPQCNIGLCKIEKNCLLGSGVHIVSGKGQHNFSDLNKPVRDQGGEFIKVTIGEDSWLGNGAIVMANIGKKCIVGAGSVVINDIPDYAIVAGNPAKVIKMRQ